MPYVIQEKRPVLDIIVQAMARVYNTIEPLQGIKADGDLNYVLFAFCKRHVKPSYNNYKNYIGELRQCATEIERKLLAKYEDEKIEENGDVE
jgi:hypothetical protein